MHRLFPYLLLALMAVAVACGAEAGTPVPSLTPGGDPLARFGENSHGWEVIGEELDAVLATPDLGTGPQRFAVVLSSDEGLVRFPVVELSSYRYPSGASGGREGPVESLLARFTEFPLGTRGLYVTEFNFDRAGRWSVEAHVPQADGSTASVEVWFTVNEEPVAVAVGEQVPRSQNRTLRDVEDVSELTTGSFHDSELYHHTIAEAVDRQRPFVVVFASPAFCTNAVCGPQVEVASELRERYGESVDFIHVDLFENPQEIQGDLSRAVETPLLDEWGLVSPEWTYVVAAGGTVAARFENFVGTEELSEAIEKAIAAGGSA
jgi:hypothetical protein